MDPVIVAQIKHRLIDIAQEHAVKILWAVESGSRGWGFPSPDSDYDCRFIYLRPITEYLNLFPGRDVIETPIEGAFDVNGWDLQKALRLMLKGNAVILEWLKSPICYRGDSTFRDDMLALADCVVERNAVAMHYLHLAYSMRKRIAVDGDQFPLKKLFYVLRPVMALRWMRLNPSHPYPPMSFLDQLDEAQLSGGLTSEIGILLHRKALTRELGAGACPAVIVSFLAEEIVIAEKAFSSPVPLSRERVALADAFFRKLVEC